MSAGIGRAKELNLDQMILRWKYVAGALRDLDDDEVRPLLRHPYARGGIAAAVVIGDALHDVEKKLARLNHTLDKS